VGRAPGSPSFPWAQETEKIREDKSMLALLWEALIGLIVGAIAKLIMPGKDPGGIFITMAIGIAGSIGATFLGQLIGWYKQGQSAGFIMSVIGAILILWIYRLIKGKAPA
jgi:uncharacterized membrane protein YeaQ/YmgE (transglycosylase-associated protein family)